MEFEQSLVTVGNWKILSSFRIQIDTDDRHHHLSTLAQVRPAQIKGRHSIVLQNVPVGFRKVIVNFVQICGLVIVFLGVQ